MDEVKNSRYEQLKIIGWNSAKIFQTTVDTYLGRGRYM